VLNVVDDTLWNEFIAAMRVRFEDELTSETLPPIDEEGFKRQRQLLLSNPWSIVYLAPRGIGPTAWDQSERKQTQIRRRFTLLGQTLDGMRVWDVRRAIQALRTLPGQESTPLWLQSQPGMAGVTLFAALFEPDVSRVDLHGLPGSLRDGPHLLNAQRFLDTPQVVAMVAQRSRVVLHDVDTTKWTFARGVVKQLGWDDYNLQIYASPESPAAGK
jgi:hypothetical protein